VGFCVEGQYLYPKDEPWYTDDSSSALSVYPEHSGGSSRLSLGLPDPLGYGSAAGNSILHGQRNPHTVLR
jgi:hypothetical protein